MSVKLTARVWSLNDPELKDARLLTLLALADFANDLCLAWPSIPTLSQRTRICERQVQRAIQWLVERSYVEIATKGNGRGNVTTYKVTLKGDIVTPFVNEKGDMIAPIDSVKGDIPSIKGDIGDENQSYARREPSTEPTTEKEKEIAADAALPSTPPVAAKPKPKRSRSPRKPPRSEAPPREPTEWQLLLEAMCWVCYGHKKINDLTEAQRGALTAEAKRISDNGRTIDDLRKWFATVWQPGWQWQKNKSRPKPSDVRSSLPALDSETPEGFEEVVTLNGRHVNGTSKVAGSLAALDQYDEIKLRHGVSR
jgi:hypothetical protein